MNSYLLNRALGSIAPSTFYVAQTTRLVHNLEPAPGIRFSSRKAATRPQPRNDADLHEELEPIEDEAFAHKAGAKCLAIDQFEGR